VDLSAAAITKILHSRGGSVYLPLFDLHQLTHGRVAQLDRVSASEAEGRGFESHPAYQ
jgi:hypothetical protein